MICELCTERKATYHLTEIVQDTKRELHICDECARKQGIVHKLSISIPDLVNKLVEPKLKKIQKEHQGLACGICGLTFNDFRSKGRFGCPNDFDVFAPGLPPILEKIHGQLRHTGKVPRGVSSTVAVETELARFRRELEESKRAEDFERCAQLRDKIRDLERTLGRTE